VTSSFNHKIILKVISRNLFIITVALLSCTGIAIYYSESISPFLLSAAISFSLWLTIFLATRKQSEDVTVQRKDAYVTVATTWFSIALLGSLPYIFSGAIPHFIDAFFESVSGFTTTGSSILSDIEALPKSILFWRSLTHWIGGIGIIVLMIVVMPSLHIGGYQLFTLESSFQGKIKPKIKAVGLRLLMIYIGLTIAEIILLMAGHMNLFESVCNSFGTIATGGFSPKNTSIADYSPYIQYVVMIFMILAGTNFVIHYYLIKREFGKVKKNEELRFYLWAIFIVGTTVTLALFFMMDRSFEDAFREGFFQVISIITCTGFATADYLQWPHFVIIVIFLSMFFGGSTGSTAGGIKMVRHLVLVKNIKRIFTQALSRHAVISIKLNKNAISEDMNNSILSFITVYILIFFIGTTLLFLLGIDGATASGAAATCMAGIGPGLGSVGPVSNFAHLPYLAKIILIFLMIIGRLEIYTVFMLFSPSFWRR
jgi:trk system potassium uptake protein TrkH